MLQVAAYCRVSTDKEDQANSFEAQQRYFRECSQADERVCHGNHQDGVRAGSLPAQRWLDHLLRQHE